MAASASSSIPGNIVEQLKPLLGRHDKVSKLTWDKINSYIEEMFGDFLTEKSLHEAGRQTTAEKLEIFEKELTTARNANENLTARLKTNQNYIAELEKLVKDAREDANRSMQDLTKSESELEKVRHTRDIVIEEKNSLISALQKYKNDIEILQEESKALSQQLKEQIEEKCSALLDKNGLESTLMEAQDRQRQAEQDRRDLERQITILNGEINITNENFDSLRYQCNTRFLEVETELSNKTEKLKASIDEIAHLNKINNELLTEVENLRKKNIEFHDQQTILCENFQKELDMKSKLIDVYKTVESDLLSKAEELKMDIAFLQKCNNDASEKKIDLENSKKRIEEEHKRILQDKDNNIASLESDLESVNEVLKSAKQQKMDEYISQLAPSAAAVSKLLNAGMSLTQVYNQLVQVMEELSQEKDSSLELKNNIVEIKAELEAKYAQIKQLQEHYDKVVDNNAAMTIQLNMLVAENNQLNLECSEANEKKNYYIKENNSKKSDIDQLSRQVCFLLKEQETKREGSVASEDQNSISNSTNSLFPSSSTISKPLITFSGIQELQENNQKLLHMVRDMATKQEEAEKTYLSNIDELQQKIKNYLKHINDLTETEGRHAKMMNSLIHQRDKYNKLCDSDPKSQDGNPINSISDSLNNKESSNDTLLTEKPELKKLQSQLQHSEKQLADFKEELKTYKQEKNTNEHMLIEQIDQMRKQITDLSTENCKYLSREESRKEIINMLEISVLTYQNQISILEERSKSYSATIGQQEIFLKKYREEAMNAQKNASRAEVALEHSQHDYKMLKVVETKLKIERDLLLHECESQSTLKCNLELIKSSIERAETETLIANEARLNGALKECNLMRLKVQEIQKENSAIQTELQVKYNAALMRQEEEKNISVQLRKELVELRSQIDKKTMRIDELTLKLKDSSQSTPPEGISKGLKEVAKLESQVATITTEIKSLNKQLTTANDLVKHYRDLSECTEKEFKALQEEHKEYKENTTSRFAEFEQREAQIKEKCAELEVELSLQSNGKYGEDTNLKSQLADVKNKLEIALKDLEQKSLDLIEAYDKANKLSDVAQNAEQKYAHEMMLHSSDIQTLTEVKSNLQDLRDEINNLTSLKNKAIENLENSKLKWETQEKLLQSVIKENEAKHSDLIQQNSDLHDQIETLNNQLTGSHLTKLSDSINESASDISMNHSMAEEEIKSSEKLLRIIKSLRRDKDLTVAKFDILQAENIRLQSQLEITLKKLDEVKLKLSEQHEINIPNKRVPTNESEHVRTIDTLNALTDSNRSLREERDNLALQVRELTIATKKLEEQLNPLQEKNKELSAKVETSQTEYESLNSEVARWRTRCKALVERANKTSPEDWKRLQNERESLVKMLSAEQENVKKLNDDLTSAGKQKSQLEKQLSNAKKQLTTSNEEIKRLTDELNIVKQDIEKISQDLKASKTSLSDIAVEKSDIMATLTIKETELNDSRKKESQIRQIAKKYKIQFEQLMTNVKENKQKFDSDTAAKETLEADLKIARETNDNLKQDLEKLRNDNQDKEEKSKMVLKQAKTKIMQLTEAKIQLASQFSEAQKTIESFNQNIDENDYRLTILKSQYEGRLARLEKEKNEALSERIKEIEALQQKVDLLQQKLTSQSGIKQMALEKLDNNPQTSNVKPLPVLNQPTTPRTGVLTLLSASGRPTPVVPQSSLATTSDLLSAPPPASQATEIMPASSSKPLQNVSTDGSMSSLISQEAAASQHVVALVMPQIEEDISAEASSAQQTPSSSEGIVLSAPAIPVARIKRSRPTEVTTQPTAKRTKVRGFERYTEVEYQVPTSSRCDQEDDGVIIVDSEEDEHLQDSIADDDDGNNGKEDSEANNDEVTSKEADADIGSEVNNEVGEMGEAVNGRKSCVTEVSSDLNMIQELPAQSSVDELPAPDGAVNITLGDSGDATTSEVNTLARNIPDASTVASASGYDDHDDGIVPSTPTLYVPRRNDGFGEAVSSPGANAETSTVTASERFTFATPALDDTLADLTAQLPLRGKAPSIVVSQAEETEFDANGDVTLRAQVSDKASAEDDATTVSSQSNQMTSPLQDASVEEGCEAEANTSESSSTLETPPGSSYK